MSVDLPHRSRWWQCDRKTLLAAAAVIVVVIGWVAFRAVVTKEERQAVVLLEEAGARVYYDYQRNAAGHYVEPVRPFWLHASGHVEAVIAHRSEITDNHLHLMRSFPRLETLDLTDCRLSGTGFGDLNDAATLKRVYLAGTELNDEGLRYVGRLGALTDLILSGTKITDVGLAYLQDIRGLQSLRIDGTQCTEAGLERFQQKCPQCRVVR